MPQKVWFTNFWLDTSLVSLGRILLWINWPDMVVFVCLPVNLYLLMVDFADSLACKHQGLIRWALCCLSNVLGPSECLWEWWLSSNGDSSQLLSGGLMSVHFLQTVHHLLSSFFEISVCTSKVRAAQRCYVSLQTDGWAPQGWGGSTTRSRGVEQHDQE